MPTPQPLKPLQPLRDPYLAGVEHQQHRYEAQKDMNAFFDRIKNKGPTVQSWDSVPGSVARPGSTPGSGVLSNGFSVPSRGPSAGKAIPPISFPKLGAAPPVRIPTDKPGVNIVNPVGGVSHSGWDKLPWATMVGLRDRGFSQATYDAPEALGLRTTVGQFPWESVQEMMRNPKTATKFSQGWNYPGSPINLKSPRQDTANERAAYDIWSQLNPKAQVGLRGMGHDENTYGAPAAAGFRNIVNQYPWQTVQGMVDNPATNKRFSQTWNYQGSPVKFKGAGQVAGNQVGQQVMGKPKYLSPNAAVATNVGSLVGNMAGSFMGGGMPLKTMSGLHVRPGMIPQPKPDRIPTAVPGMNKGGSHMTEKQMFKVAFLASCIEQGLDLEEIKLRVKQAISSLEKKAFLGLGELLSSSTAAALAVPLLAGGGAYVLGNRVLGPVAHAVTKPRMMDSEDILNSEIISEYKNQADLLKRQTELAKRRLARNSSMRSNLRY